MMFKRYRQGPRSRGGGGRGQGAGGRGQGAGGRGHVPPNIFKIHKELVTKSVLWPSNIESLMCSFICVSISYQIEGYSKTVYYIT